jgi:hypothetical protein
MERRMDGPFKTSMHISLPDFFFLISTHVNHARSSVAAPVFRKLIIVVNLDHALCFHRKGNLVSNFLEVASHVMQLDDVLICNRDLCLANLFVQNSARYGAGRTHIVDRNTLYFSLKHVS